MKYLLLSLLPVLGYGLNVQDILIESTHLHKTCSDICEEKGGHALSNDQCELVHLSAKGYWDLDWLRQRDTSYDTLWSNRPDIDGCISTKRLHTGEPKWWVLKSGTGALDSTGALDASRQDGYIWNCICDIRCPEGIECTTSCPKGKWYISTNEQCQDCSAGKWSDKVAISSDSQCKVCPAGLWSDETGLTSEGQCKGKCPVGKWSDETGLTSEDQCKNCPPGKWSHYEGRSTNCFNCDEGKWSDEQGLTSDDECKLCSEGKWSMQTGLTSDECQDCTVGKWSDEQGLTSDDECKLCSKGKWSDQTGLTSDECQGECSVGKWSDEWGLSSDSQCKKCYPGKWTMQTGLPSDQCQPCIDTDGSGDCTTYRNDPSKCGESDTSEFNSTAMCCACGGGREPTFMDPPLYQSEWCDANNATDGTDVIPCCESTNTTGEYMDHTEPARCKCPEDEDSETDATHDICDANQVCYRKGACMNCTYDEATIVDLYSDYAEDGWGSLGESYTRFQYLQVKIKDEPLKYLGFDSYWRRRDYVKKERERVSLKESNLPFETDSYLGDFRKGDSAGDAIKDSPTLYTRRYIFCDKVEWVRPAGFNPDNVDMSVQSSIQFRVMKSNETFTNYRSVTGDVWLQEYPNFKTIKRDDCDVLGGDNTTCCNGCNSNGTSSCNENSNPKCTCETGYAGATCRECAPGYHVQDEKCVECKPGFGASAGGDNIYGGNTFCPCLYANGTKHTDDLSCMCGTDTCSKGSYCHTDECMKCSDPITFYLYSNVTSNSVFGGRPGGWKGAKLTVNTRSSEIIVKFDEGSSTKKRVCGVTTFYVDDDMADEDYWNQMALRASDEDGSKILYSHGSDWTLRGAPKEWDVCGELTHTELGAGVWIKKDEIGNCCRGKCDSTAEGLAYCDDSITCVCKKGWTGASCENKYDCPAEKEYYKNNCNCDADSTGCQDKLQEIKFHCTECRSIY